MPAMPPPPARAFQWRSSSTSSLYEGRIPLFRPSRRATDLYATPFSGPEPTVLRKSRVPVHSHSLDVELEWYSDPPFDVRAPDNLVD